MPSTAALGEFSLDPTTLQPTTDPSLGFLPPDTAPSAGDGFVSYFAKPKTGLATGTTINEQASIVFDVNAAIATPVWTNTLVNDAPVSHINALPNKPITPMTLSRSVCCSATAPRLGEGRGLSRRHENIVGRGRGPCRREFRG